MPATARLDSVTDSSRLVDTGKDRIGEDRIGKKTCERIAGEYNRICVSLPKCQKLSDKRIKHIKARLKNFSEEQVILAFTKAEASNFLTGKVNHFKASFDWIIQSEDNMLKILEGKYDNNGTPQDSGWSFAQL